MGQYKLLLRTFFGAELWGYRKSRGNTQEEMAEKLHISYRSYNDLEHEKYGVSAVTLLIFMDLLSDEKIVEVVRGFGVGIREVDESVQIA